jgi:hypothetical protein
MVAFAGNGLAAGGRLAGVAAALWRGRPGGAGFPGAGKAAPAVRRLAPPWRGLVLRGGTAGAGGPGWLALPRRGWQGGGGLPVTPGFLWDWSPLQSLDAGT